MKTISNELARAIQPLETKLKLLWFGQFPALAIYVFIASRRAANGEGGAMASSQMLSILGMQAGMVLAMSFVLWWYTLSPRGIVKMLKGEQPFWLKTFFNAKPGSAAGTMKQEHVDALEGHELSLYEYSTGLFSTILVQWGLLNTCALFGMILPSHAYQPTAAAIAAGLSAICLLFQFPNIGTRFATGLELAEFEGVKNGES